jgi:hypothetical protein
MELTVHRSTGQKKKWLVTNILSAGYWDEQSKEVVISVNPFFYQVFNQGLVTLIDVFDRNRVRSPIGKCLYRFIRSHQDNVWRGHFITLATALNLDAAQPHYTVRRYVKKAIGELIRIGFLLKVSGFQKGSRDVVTLHRNPEALKQRKVEISTSGGKR